MEDMKDKTTNNDNSTDENTVKDAKSSRRDSLKKSFKSFEKKFKIVANIGAIFIFIFGAVTFVKLYKAICIENQVDYDLLKDKMKYYQEYHQFDDLLSYDLWLEDPEQYDDELVSVEGIVPIKEIANTDIINDSSDRVVTVYSLKKEDTYLVLLNSRKEPWIDISNHLYESIDMICLSQRMYINSKPIDVLIPTYTYGDYAPKEKTTTTNVTEANTTTTTTTTTQDKYDDDRTYSQYQSTVYGAVLDDYFENSYDVYDFLNVESYVDGEMYMSDCEYPEYNEYMLSPVLYDGKKVAIDPLLKDVHTVYSSDSDNIIMLEGYFFEDQSPYMYVILHSFDLEEDDFVKGAKYMVAGVSHFTYYEDVAIPYIDCYYIDSYQ